MSAATKPQSVIAKLKEEWTRVSDDFQTFWFATEVPTRLNLLRSTRDMLLERNTIGASECPVEAETAGRTRAFFCAACPELSDGKISRLASEIFPQLISARVANVEECLRIDTMFVRATVAAALPKGSQSIARVEKQMLDTRQKIMYTFLLDVLTVFSSAKGTPAVNEGASTRPQKQQTLTQTSENGHEQKEMEAGVDAKAVTADKEDDATHSDSTIPTPTDLATTTSAGDHSVTPRSTVGAGAAADAPKPPRPATEAATTSSAAKVHTTLASGSLLAVPPPSLSSATPLATLPPSAAKLVHAASTTDLRDTNAEGLRARWAAHGQAFAEFWGRLAREKLPDGSAAHARARAEFLKVVRQTLLRRMVSDGGGAAAAAENGIGGAGCRRG